MTFEQLAQFVADDFRKAMNEQGFRTFKEMKQSYMWDAQDIKEEVADIINAISEEKGIEAYIDELDGSLVFIGWNDMKWGQFKKLIFRNLK